MALKTLGAKNAAALDVDLMSTGGFSLDQLMELAGLSVSQAVYRVHPPSKGKNVLVACGPGNNGGDGLVAARHLHHYGYTPTIYYPKPTNKEIYNNLQTQLHALSIPFTEDFHSTAASTSLIVDAIFGFSFQGPARDPFGSVISYMESTSTPVLAVDAPSSWEIETGPPSEGPGKGFMPDYLISLTAAKPLVKWFEGRHFIGGRFLTPEMAKKYDLEFPAYQGIDQIVEVDVGKKGDMGGKL